MDSVIATAASGMRSRIETLDLLANNIANAGTTGYKADQESYTLYFGEKAWDGYKEGRPDAPEMPVIQRNWTDYSQGTLVPTGNNADLALASEGLFTVQGPNGPMYTRNGHFRISKAGVIETDEGYAVLGSDGKAIKVNPSVEIQVSSSGTIQQNGAAVAQLAVVNAPVGKSGERIGAGYFRFPVEVQLTPVANADVQQGKLETSNVTPASSAVKLINVMRSFEMLQKAVGMASEMSRKVVEEVARVNS
jgi:flagellar basal-body rod protein FlgF